MELAAQSSAERELENLRAGKFDFVDFGCSHGDSLKFGIQELKASRGLGLDLDPAKVASTRKAGYEAVQFDLTKLGAFPGSVSFVIMSHFLEHMFGYRDALKCIRAGLLAARDFVLIKQPWFDSDGWLFNNGLKFYWSDWRGHNYAMSQLDFYRAFRDAGVPCRYRIYGRRPVLSSDDLAIHPYDAPFDQHAYSIDKHGSKPLIKIEVPTFYEVQAIILLSQRKNFADIEPHLHGGQQNLLFEGSVR